MNESNIEAGPSGGGASVPEESRRQFLERVSIVLGGASAVLLAVPVVGFIVAPLFRKPPAAWRSVGKVGQFKIGETVAVTFQDASPLPWAGVTANNAAWLRRDTAEEFIAFAINCTHLGCPVRWLQKANLFMCPCHGGVYYSDGTVAAGPPPRPLTRYAVRVRNGEVELRTRADSSRLDREAMLKRIFRGTWHWLDDRLGISALIGPAARHLVPPDARWWYVFGSATLCAFVVQVITGVALAFSYIPSTSQAYETLRFITDEAPLRPFPARHALLRGVGDGADGGGSRGAGLPVRVLQISAGDELGDGRAAARLYAGDGLHRATAAVGSDGGLVGGGGGGTGGAGAADRQLAGAVHAGGRHGGRRHAQPLFRHPRLCHAGAASLRLSGCISCWCCATGFPSRPSRAGGLIPRPTGRNTKRCMKREGRPFWPDAAWRDVVFGVATIAGIAVLALVFGPPELGKPPDPSIIAADPRPDWYLLWYFAVLALLPHGMENYFMVFGPLLAGVVLILLPFLFNRGERSPRRRPWAVASVVMIVTMIGTLWVAGVKSDWSPNFNAQAASAASHWRHERACLRGGAAVPRQGLPQLPPDWPIWRAARARPDRRSRAAWFPSR